MIIVTIVLLKLSLQPAITHIINRLILPFPLSLNKDPKLRDSLLWSPAVPITILLQIRECEAILRALVSKGFGQALQPG